MGYLFEPQVDRAIVWNRQRSGKALIYVQGLFGTLKRLERPLPEEGFDELYQVQADRAGEFAAEPWSPAA